ncbi:MAG: 30S ribosomal protein S9 [Elusimicrobia bacterium RIFCSPLOWO2_01_FULL_54_10]|nr:MAG: 30S ribosomal protein S9 [Elusimicrobia bacterium RIFCSPLOWO2_01_FULL_54_10]
MTKIVQAVGRRKTSAAQIRMVPSAGGGKITVNRQPLNEFFRGNNRHAMIAAQSLSSAKNYGSFDFDVTVRGGGLTGQAESIRMGIARALSTIDNKFRLQMRKEGFLTRDPRAVERKKSGQPKARKRFQYSKR